MILAFRARIELVLACVVSNFQNLVNYTNFYGKLSKNE
jgi:hypothetical protein